jgi:glycosyltransferase involved in cell wall biosynthesis
MTLLPTMTAKPLIAFVPPRYGSDVLGGAEAALREMAEGLLARGYPVEVLTTCARNHFTWANELPAGESIVEGVPVHRFPTVMSLNRGERDRLEAAVLGGGELTLEQQQRWINGLFRVPDLFHHLLDHGERYRALVFAPYLFWTTFVCSQVFPDRSALLACLHDEPFARLPIFRPLFTTLGDVWFMSPPERDLAGEIVGTLPPRHALTGCGVAVPSAYDPQGFRRRHAIEGRFILYAGRREGAKGWETFLDQFARATIRAQLPFSLVTFGGGEIHPPASIADRVVDLGFISDEEKGDAFAAADAYVQPSRLEAFSRTIMEAWLARTMVIGNGGGRVVSYHCERSGAGLLYDDEYELEECLAFVANSPDAALQLGAAGREYVLQNYTWDRVLDTIEGRVAELTS